MSGKAEPVVFNCGDADLVGIVEHSEDHRGHGILIVTGGPQYRVGSHREFVYLSRRFASHGLPTMRFDYRGMGDSGGAPVNFHSCMEDIRCAIDTLAERTGIQSISLWGLCDGASASLIYAPSDARVSSLILANPWVRTDTGLARTYLSHYYLKRIKSPAFWRKMISGRMKFGKSVPDLFRNIGNAARRPTESTLEISSTEKDFRLGMYDGLREFRGPVYLMLSGDDLTAAEFESFCNSNRSWRRLLRRKNICVDKLRQMDHTFSTMAWKRSVAEHCLRWIDSVHS